MGAYAYSTLFQWENLRSLAYTSMASTYVGVGTPLANPTKLIALYNSTNQDLMISTDGINDKIIIPANSERIYDIGSNMSTQGGTLVLAQGQRLYVRYPGSDPTSGSIYFEVAYASDLGAS